jgi:hypothetical protein
MSTERDNAGRFRTGQSGNPGGRPKKDKDKGIGAAITTALNEKVAVTERGKKTRKRKAEIAAAQLANQSASGDPKAIRLALELGMKAEDRAEANTTRAPVMTQDDHEIAARVVARIKQIIIEGGRDDETVA